MTHAKWEVGECELAERQRPGREGLRALVQFMEGTVLQPVAPATYTLTFLLTSQGLLVSCLLPPGSLVALHIASAQLPPCSSPSPVPAPLPDEVAAPPSGFPLPFSFSALGFIALGQGAIMISHTFANSRNG